MARNYQFTPARQAALRKAQLVSAAKRRGRKRELKGKHYSSDVKKRGQGVTGLKKNTIPYVRFNKRSQTVGVNAGTVLPGGKKRIVLGGYARIENTSRKGGIDKALAKTSGIVAPRGTRRAKTSAFLQKHVKIQNTGLRKSVHGHTVSLGTSRGAGPTVIIRRGRKPTPQAKSTSGIKAYNKRMEVISTQRKKKKKRRPQRRGK